MGFPSSRRAHQRIVSAAKYVRQAFGAAVSSGERGRWKQRAAAESKPSDGFRRQRAAGAQKCERECQSAPLGS